MKKLRKLIERYEKIFMIVLIVVILVIFTVTGDIMSFLGGGPQGGRDPEELAGTFQVLPGAPVQVTYAQFGNAANKLSIANRLFPEQQDDRLGDIDIWTHLVLREAARHEGITVSNAQLVEVLKQIFMVRGLDIQRDREQYKLVVRQAFRASTLQFEEAIREVMTAQRVRALYQQAFLVAPPGPREEVVKQYASQNIEYARCTYAAYPATLELEAARAELKADADPDKTLKEFFEKDPVVRNERLLFQHPKRYKLELLYVLHQNVFDPKRYERLEELFFKAFPIEDFPNVTPKKLEPTEAAMRDFYRLYSERILELFPDWESVKGGIEEEFLAKLKVTAANQAPKSAGDLNEEQAAELKTRLDALGAESSDEARKGVEETYLKELLDAAVAKAPKTVAELGENQADELKKDLEENGFDLAKQHVERELRVRGMMWQLRDMAHKDASRSLKATFDLLATLDDAENPICSTEPNKGILVYRSFDEPLTGDELSDLEDSGVRFTINFRHRVTSMGSDNLPRLNQKPETMGELAHGRVVIRLIDVEQDRRKTFSELTEGDKQDLTNDFYLPEKARQRARERLEAHRKLLVDGEIAPDRFRESALRLDPLLKEGDALEASRVRVQENEWITASHDFVAQPDPGLYWASEYLHMRDRNFLHSNLALVLGRDRVKKELVAGSYLDIQLDSRSDDEDLGTAYLVVLLERRSPDAETMPPEEFDSLMQFTRRGRSSEERQRWDGDFNNLISTFRMKFLGDMQDRIQEELDKVAEKRLRGAQ